MSNFKNLQECRTAIEQFKFQYDIALEIAWNAGYALGRKRWYWGPRWFVSVQGWINTQLSKLKK